VTCYNPLFDIWRITHPDARTHTHAFGIGDQQTATSRIDFAMESANIMQGGATAAILDHEISDRTLHQLVEGCVNMPKMRRTKQLPKLNTNNFKIDNQEITAEMSLLTPMP
jgi:hypothetical protein